MAEGRLDAAGLQMPALSEPPTRWEQYLLEKVDGLESVVQSMGTWCAELQRDIARLQMEQGQQGQVGEGRPEGPRTADAAESSSSAFGTVNALNLEPWQAAAAKVSSRDTSSSEY